MKGPEGERKTEQDTCTEYTVVVNSVLCMVVKISPVNHGHDVTGTEQDTVVTTTSSESESPLVRTDSQSNPSYGSIGSCHHR